MVVNRYFCQLLVDFLDGDTGFELFEYLPAHHFKTLARLVVFVNHLLADRDGGVALAHQLKGRGSAPPVVALPPPPRTPALSVSASPSRTKR